MPKPKRARELGVSDVEYHRMLRDQGGGCAICGAKPKTRRLHTDHDHHSKEHRVRGLLCHKCNRNLPTWVTPEWLILAALYLEGVKPEEGDVLTIDLAPPEVALALHRDYTTR